MSGMTVHLTVFRRRNKKLTPSQNGGPSPGGPFALHARFSPVVILDPYESCASSPKRFYLPLICHGDQTRNGSVYYPNCRRPRIPRGHFFDRGRPDRRPAA
jgi:hypothetical protein